MVYDAGTPSRPAQLHHYHRMVKNVKIRISATLLAESQRKLLC